MRFFEKKNVRLQLLISLAFSSELLYLLIASINNLRGHIPLFLLSYGAIFGLYWLSSMVFFRKMTPTTFGSRASRLFKNKKPFGWLNDFVAKQKSQEHLRPQEVLTIGIVFGVIFRVTLLFTTPTLSDDIYRYIWDGKVASHGINPYDYPPQAEELASLRDTEIYPFVSHKEIPTIYPPVTQLTFLGLYKLNASVLSFKAGFFVLDLLTMAVLYFILRSLALDRARLLIYVWNPLVIVEFAGSGHADIIGIFLLTVVCYFVIKKKLLRANLVLVLSFLTKFIALMLLPVLTFLKKEGKLVMPILFIVFAALLYLPYAETGEKLLAGLSVYTAKWEYNSSIFTLLETGIRSVLPEPWIVRFMVAPRGLVATPETLDTMGKDLALLLSKLAILLTFSGVLLYFLVRLKKDVRREGEVWFFRLGLILLGTLFILNPTVHPWYLCWLVPFLVVVPNRAWLLLTGLVALSYWILNDYTRTGVWQESLWIKYAEYLPFYTLLIFDGVRNKIRPRTLPAAPLSWNPDY
ncbi:MAG: hypothetical protein ACE5IY_01600 [bacterium]